MIIYQTTNLINGKKYIGKDANNNPNYIGSGADLKIAIKEYGKHNFKKEIIEHCSSIDHLIERETYWLNYYDVENNPDFYNKTNKPFGNSGLSEETKQNIKQGLKKRVWNPEWGKMSGQARIGEKHSEEWNQAIKNNRHKCIEVKSKPIWQLDKNNNIISEYKSITEARNMTGIKGIPNVLIGLAKTAGGFIWKYKID